jgi:hypothetical protein
LSDFGLAQGTRRVNVRGRDQNDGLAERPSAIISIFLPYCAAVRHREIERAPKRFRGVQQSAGHRIVQLKGPASWCAPDDDVARFEVSHERDRSVPVRYLTVRWVTVERGTVLNSLMRYN